MFSSYLLFTFSLQLFHTAAFSNFACFGEGLYSGPSCSFNLQAFALQLRLIEVLADFLPYCNAAACLEVFFSSSLKLSVIVLHVLNETFPGAFHVVSSFRLSADSLLL